MKRLCLVALGALVVACSSSGGSSPSGDGGTTPPDAAVCGKLPPTGPTQVVPPSADADTETGARGAIALDRKGRPFFAYIEFAGTTTGSLYVLTWDDCLGQWRAPLKVDDNIVETETRSLSIAVDAADGRIGIGYVKTEKLVSTPRQNKTSGAFLAFSTDDGLTFTKARVSKHDFETKDVEGDSNDVDHVRVALGGGKAYLAYNQDQRACGVKCARGTVLATGVAGGAYTFEAIKDGHAGDDFAPFAHAPPLGIALALDSDGNPAVAMHTEPPAGYNTTLFFWRPGANALKITDSNNTQNDDADVSLAFDGKKPRVAYRLFRGPIGTATEYEISFSASDDGTTWGAQLPLAAGEHILYSQNIVATAGKVFIFAGGPNVFTSTDLVAFDKTDLDLAQASGSVTGAVDASGKYWVGIEGTTTKSADHGGLVLYRQP